MTSQQAEEDDDAEELAAAQAFDVQVENLYARFAVPEVTAEELKRMLDQGQNVFVQFSKKGCPLCMLCEYCFLTPVNYLIHGSSQNVAIVKLNASALKSGEVARMVGRPAEELDMGYPSFALLRKRFDPASPKVMDGTVQDFRSQYLTTILPTVYCYNFDMRTSTHEDLVRFLAWSTQGQVNPDEALQRAQKLNASIFHFARSKPFQRIWMAEAEKYLSKQQTPEDGAATDAEQTTSH